MPLPGNVVRLTVGLASPRDPARPAHGDGGPGRGGLGRRAGLCGRAHHPGDVRPRGRPPPAGARRPRHPEPGTARLRGRGPHRRAAGRPPGDSGPARARQSRPSPSMPSTAGWPGAPARSRRSGAGSTARSTRSSSSCSASPPHRRSGGGCWPRAWCATPSPSPGGSCRGCARRSSSGTGARW